MVFALFFHKRRTYKQQNTEYQILTKKSQYRYWDFAMSLLFWGRKLI
jgi:hypothetical protein